MDPLTHTAVGLFLSRAGLNRWTPRAAPILLLAANAPDIDGFMGVGGPLDYLHYHRHLTHSLAAMPVMALLPVLFVRVVGRKPVHWVGAYFAALAAVASHLALDLTNSYGIRLLLPFSDRWFRLDLASLIDLCIWAVLLIAVAGPFLSRLVGSEIQSRRIRDSRHGRGFAIFALLFLMLYYGGREVLHTRATESLNARLYRDETPRSVAAFPNAVNPMRWRGLVETSDFFALAEIDLNGDFDPSQATYLYKPEADPAIDAARRSHTIREFLRFSQFPYWQVTPVTEPEGGRLVEVFDLRFGDPQSPGFMASALVDSANRVVRTTCQIRPRPR